MKLEICSFSGYKIYPAKGRTFVRSDNRTFRFLDGKNESYFLQRLNPRKINWTVVYRRMHKKGITEEVAKKRTRRNVKVQRAVANVTLDDIKAKRNQKPEVRAAAREEAIRKEKERRAKEAAKRQERSKNAPVQHQRVSKQQARGNAPKAAATSR